MMWRMEEDGVQPGIGVGKGGRGEKEIEKKLGLLKTRKKLIHA